MHRRGTIFSGMVLGLILFSSAVGARTEIESQQNVVYAKKVSNRSQQSLDIFYSAQNEPMPVVVFIHGGGWTTGDKSNRGHFAKRDFFVENGMVFVSVNHRLAPRYFFPDYPKDIADAFAYVVENIGDYGGDPDNIFLMGHSSSAHLAALVATDLRFLGDIDPRLRNHLRGVILLDGAGYDIPLTLTNSPEGRRKAMFEQAFGKDEKGWREASPVYHLKSNAAMPPFLILYVADREVAKRQTTRFELALEEVGVPVKAVPLARSSHRQINISFGSKLGDKERVTLDFMEKNLSSRRTEAFSK